MTGLFSEIETLAAIPRLNRVRLIAFVEAEIVSPLRGEAGLVFREIDLARIELLCDLSEQFNFDDDALGVVMSVIDQLHATHRDLLAILQAVDAESAETRARIGAALARGRSG